MQHFNSLTNNNKKRNIYSHHINKFKFKKLIKTLYIRNIFKKIIQKQNLNNKMIYKIKNRQKLNYF